MQLVKILRKNVGFGVDKSSLRSFVLLRARIADVADLSLIPLRRRVSRNAFVFDEIVNDGFYGSGSYNPHWGGIHVFGVRGVDGIGDIDLFGVGVGSEKFLGGCYGVSPN